MLALFVLLAVILALLDTFREEQERNRREQDRKAYLARWKVRHDP